MVDEVIYVLFFVEIVFHVYRTQRNLFRCDCLQLFSINEIQK